MLDLKKEKFEKIYKNKNIDECLNIIKKGNEDLNYLKSKLSNLSNYFLNNISLNSLNNKFELSFEYDLKKFTVFISEDSFGNFATLIIHSDLSLKLSVDNFLFSSKNNLLKYSEYISDLNILFDLDFSILSDIFKLISDVNHLGQDIETLNVLIENWKEEKNLAIISKFIKPVPDSLAYNMLNDIKNFQFNENNKNSNIVKMIIFDYLEDSKYYFSSVVFNVIKNNKRISIYNYKGQLVSQKILLEYLKKQFYFNGDFITSLNQIQFLSNSKDINLVSTQELANNLKKIDSIIDF